MSKPLLILLNFITALTLQAQLDADVLLQSCKKGVKYLNALPDSAFPSYNQRLLLVYLHQKYVLPETPRKNILKISVTQPEDSLVYLCYSPVIGKKQRLGLSQVRNMYNSISGISKLLLWSIYPARLPLDSCVSVFESTTGPRNIMHAALALHWAARQSTTKLPAAIKNLLPQYRTQLLQALKTEKPNSDTGMEAILGLLLLNEKQLVSYRWINEILASQQSNGGWSWSGLTTEQTNTHTTLLAIWILREMAPVKL